MMDLYQELQEKTRELDIAVNDLARAGTIYAACERDYKILLRTECLRLRDAKYPIGLIDKTCYGIPSVAEARFQRDVAETKYKVGLERINSLKLQMRLIEAQISREWSIGGNG